MTFAVVNRRFPFGNPGGDVNPDGSKYGFDGSTPWSMIPILIPRPALPERPAPQSAGAPISTGPAATVAP
jgi:hypothetical protein